MRMTVFPLANPGAFHLVKISGNFGSAVKGKRLVCSSHWKIPRKSGKSKKVGSFSERNFMFSHVSRSLYQCQVHSKKNQSRPVRKTKWLSSGLHTWTSAQFVSLLPPPNDQRHTGKTVQRSSSYRKHSAKKPLWKTINFCPVPGFGICLVHG